MSMNATCVTAILALSLTSTVLADAPASTPSQRNYEVRFLTGMVDHHQMAVMMSETCLMKATHPQLLALCDTIVAAQSDEIVMMQGWLHDWYGMDHDPVMKQSDMRMMEKLEALEGDAYENGFMKEMISHHEMAIHHAMHCHHRAEHMELHHLCSNIETTQTAEIGQMEGWRCDWFKVCAKK